MRRQKTFDSVAARNRRNNSIEAFDKADQYPRVSGHLALRHHLNDFFIFILVEMFVFAIRLRRFFCIG